MEWVTLRSELALAFALPVALLSLLVMRRCLLIRLVAELVTLRSELAETLALLVMSCCVFYPFFA